MSPPNGLFASRLRFSYRPGDIIAGHATLVRDTGVDNAVSAGLAHIDCSCKLMYDKAFYCWPYFFLVLFVPSMVSLTSPLRYYRTSRRRCRIRGSTGGGYPLRHTSCGHIAKATRRFCSCPQVRMYLILHARSVGLVFPLVYCCTAQAPPPRQKFSSLVRVSCNLVCGERITYKQGSTKTHAHLQAHTPQETQLCRYCSV